MSSLSSFSNGATDQPSAQTEQAKQVEQLHDKNFRKLINRTLRRINNLTRGGSDTLRTNHRKPNIKYFRQEVRQLLESEFPSGSINSPRVVAIFFGRLDSLMDTVLITKEDHKAEYNDWTRAIVELVGRAKEKAAKIQEGVRRQVADKLQKKQARAEEEKPISPGLLLRKDPEWEKEVEKVRGCWVKLATAITGIIRNEALESYFLEETLAQLAAADAITIVKRFLKTFPFRIKKRELRMIEERFFTEVLNPLDLLCDEIATPEGHRAGMELLETTKKLMHSRVSEEAKSKLEELIERQKTFFSSGEMNEDSSTPVAACIVPKQTTETQPETPPATAQAESKKNEADTHPGNGKDKEPFNTSETSEDESETDASPEETKEDHAGEPYTDMELSYVKRSCHNFKVHHSSKSDEERARLRISWLATLIKNLNERFHQGRPARSEKDIEEIIQLLQDIDSETKTANIDKAKPVATETSSEHSDIPVGEDELRYIKKSHENFHLRQRGGNKTETWEERLTRMAEFVNEKVHQKAARTPQDIQDIVDRWQAEKSNTEPAEVRTEAVIEGTEKLEVEANQAWLRDVMEKHPANQLQLSFEKKLIHAIWTVYSPEQISSLESNKRKALTSIITCLRKNSFMMTRPTNADEKLHSFQKLDIQMLKDLIGDLLRAHRNYNPAKYRPRKTHVEKNQAWMQSVMRLHPKKQSKLPVEKRLIHALWLYYKPGKIDKLNPLQARVLTMIITALWESSAIHNVPTPRKGKMASFCELDIETIEKTLRAILKEASERSSQPADEASEQQAETNESQETSPSEPIITKPIDMKPEQVETDAGLGETTISPTAPEAETAPRTERGYTSPAAELEQRMNEFLQQKKIIENADEELAQIEQKLSELEDSEKIQEELREIQENIDFMQKQLAFTMKNSPEVTNAEAVDQWNQNIATLNKDLAGRRSKEKELEEQSAEAHHSTDMKAEVLRGQKSALENQNAMARTIMDQVRPSLIALIEEK